MGDRRTDKVEVRVTPSEKARLRELAGGRTLSDYLRDRGLARVVAGIPTARDVAAAEELAAGGSIASGEAAPAPATVAQERDDGPARAEKVPAAPVERPAVSRYVSTPIPKGGKS